MQKNITKLADYYKYAGKKIESPLICFLSNLEEQKIKVCRRTYGFLLKRDVGQMNLQSFVLSDFYIDPFVKSLNVCD